MEVGRADEDGIGFQSERENGHHMVGSIEVVRGRGCMVFSSPSLFVFLLPSFGNFGLGWEDEEG